MCPLCTYMWTYVCTISTCTRVWTSIYVLYTMYAGGGPLIVFHFGRHSYLYNWMRLYTIVSKERLLLYEDSANVAHHDNHHYYYHHYHYHYHHHRQYHHHLLLLHAPSSI